MVGLIVHEWIEKRGGAERVLDEMVAQYPDSDIACLWDDDPQRYPANRVFESWMSRTPLRRRKAIALPLMSPTWRAWKPDADYDWVLASSYVFAHHAPFRNQRHQPRRFAYIHTPARYLWAPELDPRGASLAAKFFAPMLKKTDRSASKNDSSLAANSEFIRNRIQEAWGKDSQVIYPPVDVRYIASVKDWRDRLTALEEKALQALPGVFLLGASRFVAYKGLSAVIRVGELTGLPVVLAGSGPLEESLVQQAAAASVPVHIVPSPSNNLLYALYQRARAYVFPPIEDFGIMPVEAMAAGCPVLVNAVGGSSESVVDGVSGFHLERFDGLDVIAAVERLDSLDRTEIQKTARRFDSSRFRSELADWIAGSCGEELGVGSDSIKNHSRFARAGSLPSAGVDGQKKKIFAMSEDGKSDVSCSVMVAAPIQTGEKPGTEPGRRNDKASPLLSRKF